MNIKLVMLMSCILMLAASCATGTSNNYYLSQYSEEGIVLVSFDYPIHMITEWRYAKKGERSSFFSTDYLIINSEWHNNISINKLGSKMAGVEYGPIYLGEKVLYPFRLPAGEYHFYSWSESQYSNRTRYKSDKFSLEFNVNSGQVNYIGNINLEIDKKKGSFRIKVTDDWLQDVDAYLKQANLGVGVKITKNLAQHMLLTGKNL